MPGYAYTKHNFVSVPETSPALLKKAAAAAASHPSDAPKASESAHLLTKFIETHLALDTYK